MAAAGGEPGSARTVTYITKNSRRKAIFNGGIIAISNIDLAHDAAGQALASRLAMHHFDPKDNMLLAFLTAGAARGLDDLAPDECRGVLDHVVEVAGVRISDPTYAITSMPRPTIGAGSPENADRTGSCWSKPRCSGCRSHHRRSVPKPVSRRERGNRRLSANFTRSNGPSRPWPASRRNGRASPSTPSTGTDERCDWIDVSRPREACARL